MGKIDHEAGRGEGRADRSKHASEAGGSASEAFDARGLLLAEDGRNKLSVPVLIWSRNPGHGRAHVVVLQPGEAEGMTTCELKRRIRPMGDPYTTGDETGRFARDACPTCPSRIDWPVRRGLSP